MEMEFIRESGRTAVVLPAEPGTILWYIHSGRVRSARVYEIKFVVSDAGHRGQDFVAFAWDARNMRQITWCPLQDEAWADRKDDYILVFATKEAARAAMREKEDGCGADPDVDAADHRQL